MQLINGKNILKFVSNIINEKKQLYNDRINLTVKNIYKITEKGQIDFGGSEFYLGTREKIEPVKNKSNDKYGWWDLEHGDYILIFNEKINISDGYIGYLQPLERVIVNGTAHESMYIFSNLDKVEINLRVGKCGLKIKQNARVSNLIIFKVD